jgi:hypothetical protein
LGKNRQKYRALYGDPSKFCSYRRNWISLEELCSTEIVSGCYDSRGGTNIMRTRHNVTVHVLCYFLHACTPCSDHNKNVRPTHNPSSRCSIGLIDSCLEILTGHLSCFKRGQIVGSRGASSVNGT